MILTYSSKNIRQKFKAKPTTCWACSSKHCHMMEITEGDYAGRVFEEPEYECMAAFSVLDRYDTVPPHWMEMQLAYVLCLTGTVCCRTIIN